jgi:MYXO-CTERM domain-containing protein
MGLSRRILLAVLLLLIASCSGGGCSSGCSACGIQPLPGGFPKPETIPNAGAARVTRPGLTFLQENLAMLATKGLGTSAMNGVASFQIPKSSQSGANICSPANPVPPQCTAEINLGQMKVRINSVTPSKVKLDGLLPVRLRDLPVSAFGFQMYVIAGDAPDLCADGLRGSATLKYKEFPLNVELPLVAETKVPREGYTKVDVDNAVIDIGITKDDVEFCDATCGGACQFIGDGVKSVAFNSLVGGIKDQVKSALNGAFCTAPVPTITPPCPTGSEPDNADLTKAKRCEFIGTNQCVPALLGMDGRMDLGKALSGFSPGTTGGLDFVLASFGNMTPHPSEATLPPWTPRNPPVPAEDNNKNGISLAMRGGALPQPKSNCVEEVRRDPPQDIPVPTELTGDTVTPWPAGTPGPHMGFALAGRYLDHAMLGAYNSGALCLGLSSDTVAQLNSGYLSLLAKSLKNFTFEGQTAAAGITTHPGVPPKVTIGASPTLLTINLEKFGIDFFVWSYDRYERIFTYTADVSVPLDIQTGKSEKNPNGGLLPVLGDIGIANAKVTNNVLVFETDDAIKDGISGLVGGLVGQFLGGGFSPIDIASALASAGLALEIPEGGIRKITAGTDDFLAVFANLKVAPPAARAEVDTRAALVEKIVDPTSMAIDTAVRARFPKLRVRIDSLASNPASALEHTWWIDDGTHARWTPARDVIVDEQGMLLQGKHVLHVASRVVGDVASEDSSPVTIPFVIDTLPPEIKVTGTKVEAWDYVSSVSALLMRERNESADWTEWHALRDVVPPGTSDIEVKDEEGNIGKVSLALRGRADPSIAATGSGCGCHANTTTTSSDVGGSVLLVAMAALATRRRRRSSDPR